MTEDPGIVRQSSSTSCASAGSFTNPAPYLRVMKTQLNFFMTRLLFMQEKEADSLGARATTARRMNMNNSSSSSMNFNNSASRLDHHGGDTTSMLGGYSLDDEDSDDICVYNDNARILPNSRAKSMPPIPFPPAAPESPRPVEGKDGIVMKTPTHIPLPETLPLADMALEDTAAAASPMDVEDSKPAPQKVNAPLVQRVFPKNERRSKRFSQAPVVKRSQSQSSNLNPSDEGEEDVDSSLSKSCH